MKMNINIDKYSSLPVYRQVVNEIAEKIQSGAIPYGAKLPTERRLMADTNLSRGTIKKAYEELEKQGIISIIWGSGAYVSFRNAGSKVCEERSLFDSLNERLNLLELSRKEKSFFLDTALDKKETPKRISICVISGNEESLKIHIKNLEKIENTKCYGILPEEIRKSKNKEILTAMFDIFCAPSEYEDFIINTLNMNEIKFIPFEATASLGYGEALQSFSEQGETGIFCESIGFKDSVNKYLSEKNIRIADKDCAYTKWCGEDEFFNFCENKKAVIIPPLYTLNLDDEMCRAMESYTMKGGSFKFFSYEIGADSIKLLDEAVRDMLYNMND